MSVVWCTAYRGVQEYLYVRVYGCIVYAVGPFSWQ